MTAWRQAGLLHWRFPLVARSAGGRWRRHESPRSCLHRRAGRRTAAGLAAVVLAGWLLVGCSPSGPDSSGSMAGTRPDRYRPCPRFMVTSAGAEMVDTRTLAAIEGVLGREDVYRMGDGTVTVYSGDDIDDIVEDFEPSGATVTVVGSDWPVLALGELLAVSWADPTAGAGCTTYGIVTNGLTVDQLRATLQEATVDAEPSSS